MSIVGEHIMSAKDYGSFFGTLSCISMSQQTYISPRGPSSQQTAVRHGVSHSSSGREIQRAAAAQYPGDTFMDVLQVEPPMGLVYRNSPEQRAQDRKDALHHERK